MSSLSDRIDKTSSSIWTRCPFDLGMQLGRPSGEENEDSSLAGPNAPVSLGLVGVGDVNAAYRDLESSDAKSGIGSLLDRWRLILLVT